jgi:N-acylglucosamine-6-phosphate 2-epimerase
MAECAKWAGAAGLRVDTPENIKAVKAVVDLPVIGIWKIDRGIKDVYLTPHLEAAQAIFSAGAEIIAVQATDHIRNDGKKSYEIIKEIHRAIPEALIFADITTIEDGLIAADYGADFVAPTLKNYYPGVFAKPVDVNVHPDFKMIAELVRAVEGKTRVIMEGKIYTPEQAVECLYLGAHAVVVGNAITRPHITAKRFVSAMSRYRQP